MSDRIPPLMRILVDVSEDEFHAAWTRCATMDSSYDKSNWMAIDSARNERRVEQKRRAHADTAPQHLGDWVPLREPVPCVAETGHRTFARILAKLTKDPASPGFVYFVDSRSGQVSRMTNVSESGEAALAANGIFRTDATSGPIDPRAVDAALEKLSDCMRSAPQPNAVAVNPARLAQAIAAGKIDPLDVEYDGWTLRDLLRMDEKRRNSDNVIAAVTCSCFTPAQRSAISAHWAAQLRAKVAASKQTEREQVVCERDEDGE